MKLVSIQLENFLTYESLEYDIPRTPLLVQGQNLTEDDQASNGSGKSGMFTAIEFCITGTNSRGVKDKELVMFGQKEAKIQLVAQCDVRKQFIRIEWTIKVKGSNLLSISIKEGQEWQRVSFSNVNDGKKFIMDWFAIDKDDLFNYYLISKARFKSFFKASNREKVDLINRFSDASIIDGLDEIDNSELQVEYDDLQSELDRTKGKIELLREQIEEVDNADPTELIQEATEADDAEKMKLLNLTIEKEEIEAERKEAQADLDKANKKLDKIQAKADKAQKLVDSIKQIDYTEELNRLDDEEDDLNEKQGKVEKLLRALRIELDGSITCPSCSHEFVVDGKYGTVEEINTKISKADQLNTTIEDKLTKLSNDIQSIRVKDAQQRKERQELLEQNEELFDKASAAKRKVAEFESELKELDIEQAGIEKQQAAIRKYRIEVTKPAILRAATGDNGDELNKLKEQLSEAERTQLNITASLTTKGDEIYERNKWKNNFKMFRLHLANQSLEAIEFHTNRYLKEMGSDLQIKMEGQKMLSTGKIKDEITAKILRNGERSYDSFSGGEKGRLLFAAILANRHMLNSTHKYGGLDFLFIDEIFEGVDSLGLKSLLKSAKLLDIAVMIITHVTDEDVNDDVLLIQKINGTSSIYRN